MTQSGQGEEPSARPAHEGIVLPSDGGEPLLPGMTGAPAATTPAGGQAWGGSWGPEQHNRQPDQGWPPAAAPQWGAPGDPAGQPASAAGPGPLPPEGAPAPSYGAQPSGYGPGGQDPQYGAAYGGPQPAYGTPDPYQQHHQAQQGQQHQQQGQQHQQHLAHQDQHQHEQRHPAPAVPLPPAVPEAYPGASGPLPPTADGATQYIAPVPAADGATQYIPPVQAAHAEGATQYLPPVPAGSADGATQYIPPVAAGALPPESAGEQTRYLGPVPQQAPAHSDAEATQYIPPYAAQAQGADRQPPAEFDNLFRSGPGGGDGPAGSTQQLPRVQQPDAYSGPARPSYGTPPSSYDPYDSSQEDEGRRGGRSRVPLIAAVGVGIVVIGVGAGALLSAGGGDKHPADDGKTVAAASPATRDSASPAADPARQQAVALDKLLADSGSSRASVIQAVADVKQCDNLDQAASSLRGAARQRGQLVTRLGKLTVDKLPANGDLTAALTAAWQASAAADNHYAAWAGQVKAGGHKGCKKGHARTTAETQAGNRESGTASAQKAKAAALWNAIAGKYGLTRRQPTQL
ncbi:hypothetical protein ACGFT2_10730 [Streptomyces sp. NPDC048514]|uniref:hypothetical protein n=1 Tax=Streptomyces sp. NPDC048514 TaxID=3365564 RepID=UPI003721142A